MCGRDRNEQIEFLWLFFLLTVAGWHVAVNFMRICGTRYNEARLQMRKICRGRKRGILEATRVNLAHSPDRISNWLGISIDYCY